jgi:hypothetical protein
MPAAEIAATLRDLADHQYWYPPPQAASARLAEVLAHSGDIRIPLGLPFESDPQLTDAALDFLTGPVSLGLVPWRRLRGLRLHAIDIDRAWGKGQEIQGEAAKLMMAAFGRTATLDALEGPGLRLLRQRILTRRTRERIRPFLRTWCLEPRQPRYRQRRKSELLCGTT